MNLLAHAYLSFMDEDILLGNMISDYVKGKQKDQYPLAVRRGIMLHRYIDSFTDMHPVVLEAKKIFRPTVGLYAGAFIDISFDYFLANDPSYGDKLYWKKFTTWAYQALEEKNKWHPEKFRQFFPYMKEQDWLYHYRYAENTERSLQGLLYRAKYLKNDLPVSALFHANREALGHCFQNFFPELETYARNKLTELQKEA